MARILVAENDANLLHLTTELLGSRGIVDGATTTAQALRLMAKNDYDLLITDLNMNHGGEGLVLAGAMRSLHPKARNVMVTGYPDFTGALAAIQSMLDEIHVKPVEPKILRQLQDGGAAKPTRSHAGRESIWELIGREKSRIVGDWLKLVEADPFLGSVPMSTAERLDHMAVVVEGFAEAKERPEEERAGAVQHGQERRRLGYRPEWISIEVSYMRRAIFESILRELLELDLSRFPQDLFVLNLRLDADLLDSLHAFGLAPATQAARRK